MKHYFIKFILLRNNEELDNCFGLIDIVKRAPRKTTLFQIDKLNIVLETFLTSWVLRIRIKTNRVTDQTSFDLSSSTHVDDWQTSNLFISSSSDTNFHCSLSDYTNQWNSMLHCVSGFMTFTKSTSLSMQLCLPLLRISGKIICIIYFADTTSILEDHSTQK